MTGTIPSDNPFPGSPVYTFGHRNIFGVAFDKKSGIGVVTENGDAHFDEINILKKGGNYGFPTLQPADISPQLVTIHRSNRIGHIGKPLLLPKLFFMTERNFQYLRTNYSLALIIKDSSMLWD